MSNPGVLTLSQRILEDSRLTLRIEDNIGEAIHFHFGDIRVDLTVKEFCAIADQASSALEELLRVEDFNVSAIDPIFLSSIARTLPDLECVEHDDVALKDLRVVSRGKMGIPRVTSLEHSRVFKALNGEIDEQVKYRQENLHGQSNIDRMNSAMELIRSDCYGKNGEYIILFNSQNMIRDGQHRAACLYYLNPSAKVEVLRFRFSDNKYCSPDHPWADHFFKWDKKRLKKFAKIVLSRYKVFKHQISRKRQMLTSAFRLKIKGE